MIDGLVKGRFFPVVGKEGPVRAINVPVSLCCLRVDAKDNRQSLAYTVAAVEGWTLNRERLAAAEQDRSGHCDELYRPAVS